MNCCNEKPIIELTNNEKLCKTHFTEYFENKVFRTIKKFDLIVSDDERTMKSPKAHEAYRRANFKFNLRTPIFYAYKDLKRKYI